MGRGGYCRVACRGGAVTAVTGAGLTAEPTCPYCGNLGWTVERYGRVTHKQNCPHRTDVWHQGDPFPGLTPEQALDAICQDSLESDLATLFAHRDHSEKQAVSSLFLIVADGLDRLRADQERLVEAGDALEDLLERLHRTGLGQTGGTVDYWLGEIDEALAGWRVVVGREQP